MSTTAFCVSPFAAVRSSTHNALTCRPTTLPSVSRQILASSSSSFLSRRPRVSLRAPVAHRGHAVTCNLPGNVEDLPLYRIPQDIQLMPPDWQKAGVYGVYSNTGDLNFVASTKNVATALQTHLDNVDDPKINVFSVRMMTVDELTPEVTEPLNMFAERWVMALHENGLPVPVGNTEEGAPWRIAPHIADVSFSNTMAMPDDETRVKAEIELILRDHRVVLFMKGTKTQPMCGFSRSVVDILTKATEDAGQTFVCVNCLDGTKNGGLREGIKMYSNWPTIPQLYIDGDFVGGADIVEEMQDNGELAAALAS